MGGGKDAGIVLGHDPHAIKDRMITDAIFATDLSQGRSDETPIRFSPKERWREHDPSVRRGVPPPQITPALAQEKTLP